MKREATALEMLFPEGRAALLRLLFGEHRRPYYVRELHYVTELALSTVQSELRNLQSLEIVTSWSNGYHTFYGANGSHPLTKSVCEIVKSGLQLKIGASAPRKGRAFRTRKRHWRTRRPPLRSRMPQWADSIDKLERTSRSRPIESVKFT
jgi:hypothetical protein